VTSTCEGAAPRIQTRFDKLKPLRDHEGWGDFCIECAVEEFVKTNSQIQRLIIKRVDKLPIIETRKLIFESALSSEVRSRFPVFF
jgi:hypothetical protein